jgi:putative endonuclease
MTHHCYIVRCSDDTLYCGYSNNLEKRIKTHNDGKGAKYTKTRRPVVMVYSEAFDTKSEAMKREYQIKQITRNEKIQLILKYDKLQNIG